MNKVTRVGRIAAFIVPEDPWDWCIDLYGNHGLKGVVSLGLFISPDSRGLCHSFCTDRRGPTLHSGLFRDQLAILIQTAHLKALPLDPKTMKNKSFKPPINGLYGL